MRTRTPIATAALIWLSLSLQLAAQTQANPGQPRLANAESGTPVARPATDLTLTLDLYSESKSRVCFQACDANGDDLLSILEAKAAMSALDQDQIETFRKLDRDSDGYLSFAEFDRTYRAFINRGVAFTLRPVRPPAAEPKIPQTTDLLQANRLIALHDKDGDEMLSLAELHTLLERQRRGEDARQLFIRLDSDGSGRLAANELVELAKVPGILAAPDIGDPNAHGRLPPAWRDADLNQDGSIAESELDRQLKQLDPLLRRWTKRILTDADSSGNGALNLLELQAAAPPPLRLQPQLSPDQIKKLLSEQK